MNNWRKVLSWEVEPEADEIDIENPGTGETWHFHFTALNKGTYWISNDRPLPAPRIPKELATAFAYDREHELWSYQPQTQRFWSQLQPHSPARWIFDRARAEYAQRQGRRASLKLSWEVEPDVPNIGARVKTKDGRRGTVTEYKPSTTWKNPEQHGDLWIEFDNGERLGYPASHWAEQLTVVK